MSQKRSSKNTQKIKTKNADEYKKRKQKYRLRKLLVFSIAFIILLGLSILGLKACKTVKGVIGPDLSKTNQTSKPQEKPEIQDVVNRHVPYTSNKMYKDIDKLVSMYPDILSVETYGKSVLQKKLKVVKLGKGERKVLWTGSIHSREVITTNYLMQIIQDYANAYTTNTRYGNHSSEQVNQLLNEFTVYVAPMTNPDGVDICNADGKVNVKVDDKITFKGNANGVNLNRNFPFHWEKSTHEKGDNYDDYRGSAAGSEPESVALMKLCRANEFEHVVNCHVQGEIIFWKDIVSGEVPGDEKLAKAIADVTGFKLAAATTHGENGYAGGFENWFRHTFDRPGICVEFATKSDARAVSEFDNENMMNWEVNKNLLFSVLEEIKE